MGSGQRINRYTLPELDVARYDLTVGATSNLEVQRAALELSGRAEKCIVLSKVLREKDEEEKENVAVNQY